MRAKHFRAAVRSRKPALKEMAARFLNDGLSEADTIREIVEIVDHGIDWVAIGSAVGPVGAVVGAILETADGPIAIAIVTPIVRAVGKARARG